MSRFDRYLLSQLLALFCFFALILIAIYWINRTVGLFDQLLSDGQSAFVFIEFSLLILPNLIRLVLPVATFAAAIYVTNRLVQESELLVMQATGLSPFRLARPVVYFGVIVTVLHLALMNILVPWSLAMLTTRQQSVSQEMTARFMKKGQFMQPAKDVTLYIRDFSSAGELMDVFLADDRDEKFHIIYNAKRALILRSDSGPKLLMLEGTSQRLELDGRRKLSITRFDDATYELSDGMTSSGSRRANPHEMTSLAILSTQSGLDWTQPQTVNQVTWEIHGRLSQPFLSLTSALLGFSALLLGAFSRFGLWRQILGAVLGLIVIQMISTLTTSIVLRQASMWPILYIAPFLGCLSAAGILWFLQRTHRLKAAIL
ncbi:MAG: LPS export ABC transporter permease LptF [Rhodobacteraceae bacterium]|nr:LPS export ABC transporter permease LptF [Paracoccaceae bacterium]